MVFMLALDEYIFELDCSFFRYGVFTRHTWSNR